VSKITMDPELKKEWIEALRSGEYEQGQLALCSQEDKFCCLGVLYDLTDAYWLPPRGRRSGWRTEHGSTGAFGNEIIGHEVVNILIGMNDDGETFEEIADYIEENL